MVAQVGPAAPDDVGLADLLDAPGGLAEGGQGRGRHTVVVDGDAPDPVHLEDLIAPGDAEVGPLRAGDDPPGRDKVRGRP